MQRPLTLAAGAFFGQPAQRRDVDGLHLSEHEYAPGLVVPAHAHERAYVGLVVAGGYVERIGSRRREHASRSLLFHPANEEHEEAFASVGGQIFHVQLPPRILDLARSHRVSVDCEPRHVGAEANATASRLRRELRDWDSASPLAVEGLAYQLLAELSRPTPRGERRRPAWLRRVLDLAQARFRDHLTLTSVAREVGVDPAHLARTFRAHEHCTLGEYVRGLRVEHGCRLLATTDQPLAWIALEAGFADQAHFCRTFRRYVGATPSDYRRSRAQ